ncbi:MAG: hypothetical protein RIM99_01640 [Cyclobacteriaceae bacterium]
MKKLFVISVAVLSLSLVESNAQLLEDNQSRLKTKKVSRGFFLFRNKNKTKSATGDNKKVISNVSPRSSQRNVSYRTKGKTVSPRYSSGSPFGGRAYKVSPRYSLGSPFRGAKYKVAPRYSFGNPFRGARYKVSPRYSGGKPFRASDYRVTPRYSLGNPFRGARYKVSPRYSSGSPFRARDYKVNPRYSVGNPFRGARYKVSPRYSQGHPFTARDYKVNPRYSVGNPFRGINWKVTPRYSNSKNRFVVNNYLRKQLRYYNETSNYKGNWKMSKRGKGDQHPSSNYHFAMRFSNPKIRKMFRKWNIYWVRINGNKEQSNGVRANVRSPKFDKKEKDLWNN